MSLLSALYTGVSGLQSFGDSLQVIGNNIANVNTVGFKTSRAEFATLLSQPIAGGSGRGQLGRGVSLDRVSSHFSQGSFSNTNRLTDLAINGNGFFVVNDGNRGFYTRNGQFTLDANGNMINSLGHRVQGYQYDTTGNPLNTVADLKLTSSAPQPIPTGDGSDGSGIIIFSNLDQRTPISSDPFDILNPGATSDFSTSITVYDIAGDSHNLQTYFKKTADDTWEWHGVVNSGELFGGVPGTPPLGGSGIIAFTTSGALDDIQPTVPAVGDGHTVIFNFCGNTPATEQPIGLNFGDPIQDGLNLTGLGGTTQFASPNVVSEQNQDGFASGSLASLQVAEDGLTSGIYTNGRSIQIGQIALANFANLQGFFKAGPGIFADTSESGVPIVGEPSTGSFGTGSSFTLELSNVDLANEFVNLISTQRAYQANSKIITTVDQLLSETVNIIR
jgi:flagellar hook protein FlgE